MTRMMTLDGAAARNCVCCLLLVGTDKQQIPSFYPRG